MNFPRKKNESNTEYSRRVITAGMSVIVRVDSKCSQIIDGYNYGVFSPGNGEWTHEEMDGFTFIDIRFKNESFFDLYKRILTTHKKGTIIKTEVNGGDSLDIIGIQNGMLLDENDDVWDKSDAENLYFRGVIKGK